MLERLKRKLMVSVGFGALVFLGLSVYSDLDRLMVAFSRFKAIDLVFALSLALTNYLIRFIRWHIYLGRLEIRVPKKDSLLIFFAGLVMSVTPGKAGELLKAYLVRARVGTPVSRCVPVVLAERLTDFISLIFLAFMGIFSFQRSLLPLLGGLGVIGAGVLVLGRPSAATFLLRLLRRLPRGERLAEPLFRAYESVRVLVAPVNLLWATGLGVVAWFAECLGFSLVLKGFGAAVGVVQATFIYSFSTLFGALTMLPGGLGVTEGSLSGLLVMQGVGLPDAVAATFVIRVCTLWFAVALGAIVLLRYQRRFGADLAPAGEPDGPQSVQ